MDRSALLPPLMLPTSGGDPPRRRKRRRRQRSNGAPNPVVVDGAKAVWRRMRRLEDDKVASAVPEPSEEQRTQMIDGAAELLKSPERQQEQIRRIADVYRDFVAGVKPKTDAWRAVHKYVHEGQSHFNEYLEWTDEGNGYGGDITKYQEETHSDSDDEAEDEYDHDDLGPMDEDDEGDWVVWGRPERQVFALYSLFKSAPTLSAPTVVLHSSKSKFDLPHGPREGDSNTYATRNAWMPTPGRAYLNKAFVSTSLAPLNDFLSAGPDPQPKLSEFYAQRNLGRGCCMCAIVVDPGVPTMPIFMENKDGKHYRWDHHAFDWHGFHGEEQELLLPPGLLYVFLGRRKVTVVDVKATRVTEEEVRHHFNVFFYRAMLPPGA
jgi:hypothetical protein